MNEQRFKRYPNPIPRRATSMMVSLVVGYEINSTTTIYQNVDGVPVGQEPR